MWTLTAIAVGFVVVSAGVAVLARSTTARWERERRGARAPRREVVEPSFRAAVASRLGRALAGTEATARTVGRPARGVARIVGRGLTTSRQHVAHGVRRAPAVWDAIRRMRPGLRVPTGHGPDPRPTGVEDAPDDGSPLPGARIPARRAHARRRLRVPGRGRTTAIPRLTHQLAARVVRRPGRRRARRDSDEHSGPAS